MNADTFVQKLEGDIVVFTGDAGICGGARVALVTDSGDEYAIAPKGAGADLAELLSARVAVSCEIRSTEGDAACIQVRSYTLLDEFPDE
ncbi:hypothetical protein LJC23_05000 [Desulfovibrio sp. OttesenSCG-928-I05]|nr:hypothetical protein [Desulfovibrio sp. OttesenSCG-928-I05]